MTNCDVFYDQRTVRGIKGAIEDSTVFRIGHRFMTLVTLLKPFYGKCQSVHMKFKCPVELPHMCGNRKSAKSETVGFEHHENVIVSRGLFNSRDDL